MTATEQTRASPPTRVVTVTIRQAPEAEPVAAFECPCPLAGLRCRDCMMIAFAPPPFTATPVGWALATGRRLGWRIRELFTHDA